MKLSSLFKKDIEYYMQIFIFSCDNNDNTNSR